MEQREQLKLLEADLVSEALEQLSKEVERLKELKPNKVQAKSLEKAVKLVFQCRALLGE